jgi:hypothetical protein
MSSNPGKERRKEGKAGISHMEKDRKKKKNTG